MLLLVQRGRQDETARSLEGASQKGRRLQKPVKKRWIRVLLLAVRPVRWRATGSGTRRIGPEERKKGFGPQSELGVESRLGFRRPSAAFAA